MFDLSKYNAGDLLWLGDWSAGWIALLAVVGAIVIAISAYDLRNLSPARRWLLVGLRSVVYGLAVLVLLEPALDLKHVSKVRSDVAVLVDQSRSMSLKADKETDKTRAERSREALDELEPLFERKSEDHNFHFFHFGDSLESTSGKAAGKGEPDADASDLSGALEEVGDEIDRDNLGGMVLLSDGIATGAIGRRVARGEELDEATRQQLQSLDAPINTRAAASSEGLRDVAITDVLHDDFAFVHNKVSVDVRLQVIGMDKRTIPVQLRRDGELLQTRQISVDPDKTTYEVTFEFVPEQIGKEVYSVSTPEFSGEVLDENNIDHFLLNVIRDKIRVLQVVGEPNWDERFLRRHLKQNPNYDLVSFFILRTDSDVQQVPNDELSLIPFPTRELFEEELGSFDLVIFQNFAFGPYQMHQYLPHIADFVRDGGGFAMIGGEQSFGTGGYGGTPIEEILPVNLPQMGDSSDALDTREFNPELTEAGQTHPITQLAFDPDKNREIWADLPQMQGSNLVYPKSGATTLATHPDIEQGGEKMPMIAVDDIEEGRSMALAGDSSWRWKFRHVGEGGSSRRYEHFWNRAIRWLIRDPELKLINVDVADDIAPPGDDQEVTITISEPDYTPASEVEGELRVLRRDLEKASDDEDLPSQDLEETHDFETDDDGEARLTIPVEDPGVYELEASAETSNGSLSDDELFLAVPDVDEFRRIIPREDLLEMIASETGGHYAVLPTVDGSSFEFEPPRRVEVNRRRVVQLWDNFALFAIILGLLGAEWWLRRRWGRL